MQGIESTLLLTGEHKLLYPGWDKGDNVDEYASIKCSQAKATKKYGITFLFTNEVDVLLKNLETEIMDKLLVQQCVPFYVPQQSRARRNPYTLRSHLGRS